MVGGGGADGKFWHIVPEHQTTAMGYPMSPPPRESTSLSISLTLRGQPRTTVNEQYQFT